MPFAGPLIILNARSSLWACLRYPSAGFATDFNAGGLKSSASALASHRNAGGVVFRS